jgi:DNA-binding XRE family transcriptional regulator
VARASRPFLLNPGAPGDARATVCRSVLEKSNNFTHEETDVHLSNSRRCHGCGRILWHAAIARTIIARREAAGLSQKELAKQAGTRAEVLNRAERGAVIPSMRALTKIEAALRKHE